MPHVERRLGLSESSACSTPFDICDAMSVPFADVDCRSKCRRRPSSAACS